MPLMTDTREHGDATQVQVALLAGGVLSVPVGDFVMRFTPLVTHIHHTTVEEWLNHPLLNIAGDSTGTVKHRTGLELQVGLTIPDLHRFTAWSLDLEFDALLGTLPTSDVLAWAAGGRIALALREL